MINNNQLDYGFFSSKKLPGHRLPHESQISDYCEDELGAGNRTLNPYIRSIYKHHKFRPMEEEEEEQDGIFDWLGLDLYFHFLVIS